MKITLEFHPATGGADAETFAAELAVAVARHAGTSPAAAGRVQLVHCL